MVARKRLTAAAVGLLAGQLAQPAAYAEAPRVYRTPVTAAVVIDAELFRIDIEGYKREIDRQMRATLNEELRRELARKVVLASNELRTTT